MASFLLYTQHGWADTHHKIAQLGQALTANDGVLVAPNLGYLKTWLRITPLVEAVENIAKENFKKYPHLPIRIIGHSMGGLIWLEVLDRHPEWWSRIENLVLIGSPVGGADIARIIDPLGLGIGIAKELGINRRHLAEKVAQGIPTLTIAGDLDQGSDGTVTIETTKFSHAHFICLPNLSHVALKNHPSVVDLIQAFWRGELPPPTVSTQLDSLTEDLINDLRHIEGMTDAHYRGFEQSRIVLELTNGVKLRRWKNSLKIEHIFLEDPAGDCCYAGYVGWLHQSTLEKALVDMERQYKSAVIIR